MQWAKCSGRRCDACAAGRTTKKGHVQHYEVGFGHFTQIQEYSKMIGKTCKSCGTRDSIQSVAFLCPHCKEAVIDMSTTNFTDEEIAKMVDDDMSCPHCKQTGLLEEVIECGGVVNGKPCYEPVRAGIFDVDVSFKKVADPNGGNQNTLMFTGYGPVCDIDPIYDVKPLKLDEMFAPTDLERQSRDFQVAMPAAVPRQPVPAANVSRPYGAQQPVNHPDPQQAPTDRPGRSGGMFNRS
jgi:hypothetical protein